MQNRNVTSKRKKEMLQKKKIKIEMLLPNMEMLTSKNRNDNVQKIEMLTSKNIEMGSQNRVLKLYCVCTFLVF